MSMIKVVTTGSYNFDEPVAKLVDIHSRGVDSSWMHKRAAVMSRFIQDLRPEPGHSYIHLISMGAQEAYGPNRNGDGFNEKQGHYELEAPMPGLAKRIAIAGGLLEYHDPYFTKHAHVYKNHKNTDPQKSIGSVKAAAYNHEMRRGELIIRVPHDTEWEGDLQKLATGKDVPFSMACKVAYDICSHCGNKAKTRKEYCDHLKDNMLDITKEGNQIFAINDRPAFFDISKVIRPADRIAWSLQKVASVDLAPVIGGAELAEMLEVSAPAHVFAGPDGVALKLAAADKLATIEKLVEGLARGGDNKHLSNMAGGATTPAISDRDMVDLRKGSVGGVLGTLKEAQICLAPCDFFRLVMGEKYASIADNMPLVEGMLPGMFNRLLVNGEVDECATDCSYDPTNTAIPRQVKEAVGRLMGDHSFAAELAETRITRGILRDAVPALSQPDAQKTAAVSKQASMLLKEYAKYVLSFSKTAGDEISNRLTVLRNYLTV